jgi:hypothetical protein
MRVLRVRYLYLELGVRVTRHPRYSNVNAVDCLTIKITLLSITLYSSSTLLLLQRLALSSFITLPFYSTLLYLALPYCYYSVLLYLARYYCAATLLRLTFLTTCFILLYNFYPYTLLTSTRLLEQLKLS